MYMNTIHVTRIKQVKKIFEKVFRYRLSTICFIVGMVVSILALYYGNRSIYEYNCSVDEMDNLHFKYETKAMFYGKSLPVEDIFVSETGNCTLYGTYLTINKSNVTTGIWISLYNNEEYKLPIDEGAFPSKEELEGNVPVAVIGADYRDAVYVLDGKKYIDIQGEKYLVTGIISGKSSEFDDRVLLFAKNIGKMARETLESDCSLWGIGFWLQSDIANMENTLEQISERLSACGDFKVQSKEYVFYQEVRAKKNTNFFLILLYSLGVTAMISVYWMYERKDEILIRKKYAFGSGRIIGILLKDLLLTILIAILISVLIIVIINNMMNGYIKSIQDELTLIIFTFATYILFAGITALAYPVYLVINKKIK